jgi:hypothetical protein
MKKVMICAAIAATFASTAAHATLDLTVVGSMNVTSAFGLAFDGTNVWYSTPSQFQRIDQATMTALGSSFSVPVWSEIAWDGSHIVFASGSTLTLKNTDGTSAGTKTLTGGSPGGLIDGLDIDGGKVWYSPDVSFVDRYDYATGAFEARVLPSGGGFSGVEKITVGSASFLMVVNDASSPRKLCRTSLAGAFSVADDCATLPNSRYEGLAFDGRYLYAADYYGNRIDKIDLKVDGGSIFVPPPVGAVPEPETYALMLLGLAGVAGVARRKNHR